MFVLFATFKIQPSYRDAFAKACQPDSAGSLHHEPGCFRFDLLKDNADPNTFYLYEAYADEAAYQFHLTTPHFHRWQAQVKDWFMEPVKVIFTTSLFPEPPAWHAVKETLIQNVADSPE